MNQNSGMTRLLIGLVVGVILGLGIGLLFGYVIAPVQWTDVSPQELRTDYGAYYWALVTESYDKHGDLTLAQKQLGVWDDEARRKAALEFAYVEASPEMQMKLQSLEEKAIGATTAMPTPSTAQPTPAQPTGEEPAATGGLGSLLRTVGLGLLLILVFIVIVVFLFLRLRKSKKQAPPKEEEFTDWSTTMPTEGEAPQTPPLAHFVTSYALGNDVYDESFSIESPGGDFMGECGVGISETIDVGDPDKVTAFEVWLFDKNDIRTVTRVLMSEYAFNDQELRARLATKGEPALIVPGKPITIETLTLRIDVMVTEAVYGTGTLPANSFFDRLTLELITRSKEANVRGVEGELDL
ncbi:MAG: hypothetical protein JW934_13845 [Anaerolineae bacterium]|nr:hypothetical protein [Anaerolineae bacterium]